MISRTYTIRKRKKRLPESFASIRDFKLGTSATADTDQLLRDPTVSLYCADFNSEQVVFVQTPASVDLSAYPFLYLAQYEHAVNVITVPFADISRFAATLPEPAQNIILLYTVGRSGSTLLSKMVECAEGTVSLSEPDILTDFVIPLKTLPERLHEIERLFSACVKILCADTHTHGKHTLFIKPRGVCVQIWQTLQRAVPQSKIIFLYRNARPVIESYMRAFLNRPILYPLIASWPARKILQMYVTNNRKIRLFFPNLESSQIKAISRTGIPGFILATWLSIMKTYDGLRLQTRSISVRYEDIVAHPQGIMSKLFDYCAIPSAGIAQALETMKIDAQQGTRMSAKTGHNRARLNSLITIDNSELILQHENRITSLDYIFPDSIQPFSD